MAIEVTMAKVSMTEAILARVCIIVLTEWELLIVNASVFVVDMVGLMWLVDDIHVSMVMWMWQLVVMLDWLSHLMYLVLNWVMRGNWMLMLNMVV